MTARTTRSLLLVDAAWRLLGGIGVALMLSSLAVVAAEEADDSAENTTDEADEPGEGEEVTYQRYDYPFQPKPLEERGDIFLSIIDRVAAEREIAALREAESNLPVVDGPEIEVTTGPVDDQADAEAHAAAILEEIRAHYTARNWRLALDASKRRLVELERLSARFNESTTLQRSVVMVRNYAQQAEEKVLYEEARTAFNALELRIVGIIWAEDQDSLAIIAGEPVARGVNDRVRGTVIQSIDRNQVSFLFAYNRRKYTFLRYIGEDF